MQLKDKVALITGASSGIGNATAKVLAADGAHLVLAARRKERLDELKEELESNYNVKALTVSTDVTKREEVKEMAETAIEQMGQVDILVNNAGLMPLSYMKNTHIDEWEQMVDVNLKGVLYAIGYLLPHMRERQSGHIINISSVAGRKVMPGGGVYCATKFGIHALSETMRQELAPTDNIRVTMISPGAVATELFSTITDEEIKKNIEKMGDAFTFLQDEDIANSIYYAVTQPDYVNIGEVYAMPTGQPS